MNCFQHYDLALHCSSKSLTLKSKAMSRAMYPNAARNVILYFIDGIPLYKTAVGKAISVNENCLKDSKSAHQLCVLYIMLSPNLTKILKTS